MELYVLAMGTSTMRNTHRDRASVVLPFARRSYIADQRRLASQRSERLNVRALIPRAGTVDLSHWIVEGMGDVRSLALAFFRKFMSESKCMQGEARS